ncbi:hypothetical protein [Streptomyces resistomycificus]|uniref:Phage protein n=1 Tax=Streptomyces resistomycificus TaxID=67356 RepID=A0A0L8KZS1_9ACTN|nr:hypothetical protein [Streptomyces resistomycificus]KOG31365.1 hypothetical protein ADK37_30825 [Streptomyces resistomycificus]KUN94283.1 hypothetical protein AQJ84_26695 [Streptomyces resistomycificus]
MKRFRKRPVEIDAVQLRPATWSDVIEFVGDFPDGMRGVYLDENNEPQDYFTADGPDGRAARIGLLIPTLEGTMLALEDDWIIRGVRGELYSCRADIFRETYEEVAS